MSYTEKHENITKDDWINKLDRIYLQRADMNRLVMNYLVTEGFKEAAEKFQQESGIDPGTALDSLDERIKIRDAIQNGAIQEATTMVNELHPELLDNDRYLYFHLQQLHLIELIRANKLEEALQFAQEHLSEAGESDPNALSELERTLALLAFEEPLTSPFNDLLQPNHRQKACLLLVIIDCEVSCLSSITNERRSLRAGITKFGATEVASELNEAILKMENQELTTPQLSNLLKVILWSQDELDKKRVRFPRLSDLATATISSPK